MKNYNLVRLIIPLLMFILFACDRNITRQGDELSEDEQLIIAIQASLDKVTIGEDQLPSATQEVIDYDYPDQLTLDALIAPSLGYEVLMGGRANDVGKRSEIYFNLDGRELKFESKKGEKRGHRGHGKDKWKCFDLIYPITYIMPDESTITVDDENDYENLKAWFEANPDSEEKPIIQFPIQIVFDGEEALTVNSLQDMRDAYERCGDRRNGHGHRREPCFELVYPVTFIMPDSSSIIVDEDADMMDLRFWYADHPDAVGHPELVYPVEIVYETDSGDSTATINDEVEMLDAKAGCRRFKSASCYIT